MEIILEFQGTLLTMGAEYTPAESELMVLCSCCGQSSCALRNMVPSYSLSLCQRQTVRLPITREKAGSEVRCSCTMTLPADRLADLRPVPSSSDISSPSHVHMNRAGVEIQSSATQTVSRATALQSNTDFRQRSTSWFTKPQGAENLCH